MSSNSCIFFVVSLLRVLTIFDCAAVGLLDGKVVAIVSGEVFAVVAAAVDIDFFFLAATSSATLDEVIAAVLSAVADVADLADLADGAAVCFIVFGFDDVAAGITAFVVAEVTFPVPADTLTGFPFFGGVECVTAVKDFAGVDDAAVDGTKEAPLLDVTLPSYCSGLGFSVAAVCSE